MKKFILFSFILSLISLPVWAARKPVDLNIYLTADAGVTINDGSRYDVELFFEDLWYSFHITNFWKVKYGLNKADERLAELIILTPEPTLEEVELDPNVQDQLVATINNYKEILDKTEQSYKALDIGSQNFEDAKIFYNNNISRGQAFLREYIRRAPGEISKDLFDLQDFLSEKLKESVKKELDIDNRRQERIDRNSSNRRTEESS